MARGLILRWPNTSKVQVILKNLIESKVLVCENDVYSNLSNNAFDNLNALNREEILPTVSFLNLKALEMIEKKSSTHYPNNFYFSINSLSKKQMDKINYLMFRTKNEMVKIFEEKTEENTDCHPVEVRAMLLQAFTLASSKQK